MGQPAARVTDMHTCPMVTPGTPPVPHVGGPILPTCSPNVITGGLPQARVTDKAYCVGPPDVIVKGSMTVLVNNLPAARIGDQTIHGGVIVTGMPTVLIGDMGGGSAGTLGSSSVDPAKVLIDKIKDGKSNIKIEGDDAYKKATLAALETLSKSPTGLKLLQALDSSGKTTTIEMTEPGKGNTEDAVVFNDGLRDPAIGKAGPGTDTVVHFNPDRDKIDGEDWMTRDPAIGLGHELIHAHHDTRGTTDGRPSVSYKDADGNDRSAPGYELQTVGLGEHKDDDITENKIRQDFADKNLGKNGTEHQRPRY